MQTISSHLNVLTVDLEEWFVVEALAGRYQGVEWDDLPSTIERNSDRLLSLFARKNVRATWFVVGWCAERHPMLVRRIIDAGHEIGCHSYYHRQVSSLTADEFQEDTEMGVAAIVEAAGVKPKGYRAPSWSISDKVPWAFEVLARLGFEYDSSIFPIKHDIYGMPDGPREMFRMSFEGGNYLWEIPASTIRVLGRNFPLGGGGYLRHSPYWYTKWMIDRLNRSGLPAIVYIHPWEIDPNPPKVEGLSQIQKFRSYGSTSLLEQKLEKLLSDFSFTDMSNYIRLKTQKTIGFER